jgi:hypothetical protein
MRVVKNKYKSICEICAKPITIGEYPYKVQDLNENYHLFCFHKWLKKRVEKMECSLKKLRTFRTQLKKHGKQLLLETLENNTQ